MSTNRSVAVYYRQLPQLSPDFVKKIKYVSIFGRYGTDVLIVTKDDKVWAFGDNGNGCLGVGTNLPVSEPTLVPELCHKKVVRFAFGQRHTLALTKNGQIYSFGYNEYGQLANRTTIDCYVPKLILISEILNNFVTDVCCGAFHSLALTKTGIVFAWGFNFWGQLGIGYNRDQSVPIRMYALSREVIIAICCGHHHSLALSKSGYVYSWGHNAFGQLGAGGRDRFRNIPVRVRVISEDIIVSKVMCGQNHSLMLSEDGTVYAFGRNNFGQVGSGDQKNQYLPVRVPSSAKFVDIACSMFSNTSTALSSDKRSHIWGQCGDDSILLPIDTPLKTMQELFARYNYVTFDAIFLNRKKTFPERVISFVNGMKKRLT